jgi:hypothetical protein
MLKRHFRLSTLYLKTQALIYTFRCHHYTQCCIALFYYVTRYRYLSMRYSVTRRLFVGVSDYSLYKPLIKREVMGNVGQGLGHGNGRIWIWESKRDDDRDG